MKRLIFILPLLAAMACSQDIPTVSLGLDDVYYIERMRKLRLAPAFTGEAYRWTVDGREVSDQRNYIFIAAEEGTYHLAYEVIDEATPYRFEFDVVVMREEVEYSPYIADVLEYCPAPGQFVNLMPEYEEGDTYADMLKKAKECIEGTNDIMISLGAYGGYVTFAFDHTVMNVPGEMDFRIWGNSFYELTDNDRKGGSAEPGIVMVSYDTNCNGLPDDEWYELRGSEWANPLTIRNYSITYAKGLPDQDVQWHDSEGNAGSVERNMFHDQPYWPQWVDASALTFTGTRLPPNGIDTSGFGRYYILYCYDWGYVDNHPNDYPELNSFDIDNAVDAAGRHVDLPGADFIRVYTGVNQYCGWLGETSTEIARAQDLHILDFRD